MNREAHELKPWELSHDDAIQALHRIGYLIDSSQQQCAAAEDSESLAIVHAVALERIRHAVQAVAAQLRGVVSELRPAGLDDLGLTAALEAEVQRHRSARGPDLPAIALDLDSCDAALPRAIALCLFRAAQEALRNALQHAQARHIELRLRFEAAAATLWVRDDGVGLPGPANLNAFAIAGHFGLAGITERVAAVGGQLTIDTQPGIGTSIKVWVPCDGDG